MAGPTCELCGNPYVHGPHRYEGHQLPQYGGLFVCQMCWDANHDGWAERHEEKLLAHLKTNNLPIPRRNENGYLPRGGAFEGELPAEPQK